MNATVPALVSVPFYGDAIDAIHADEKTWVSLIRVCESLGLAADTQRRKLEEKPWATTTLRVVVAEDGKRRQLTCVDLQTLPMWLATIDIGRVKPECRDKLKVYQCEAARVLAEHFLPKPLPAQELPQSHPRITIGSDRDGKPTSIKIDMAGRTVEISFADIQKATPAYDVGEVVAADIAYAGPVWTFVAECCVLDPAISMAKADLYAEYEKWSEIRKAYKYAISEFFKRLYIVGPPIESRHLRGHGGRRRVVMGIGLRRMGAIQ